MDIEQFRESGSMTARRSLGVYLAVATGVCFLFSGRTDLIRMEPIIALGGRHMLETGRWFVPRLYGQVYAFKPALAYWLAAASQSIAGSSELALRLPTAACGVLLGLFIQQTLARLASARCGLYGGLLAVFSFLFIEQARMVGFDMPLALGVGVAMLTACRNLVADRPDWRWWLLGYCGLLVGFLAKGLPAVLLYFPGLILAAILLRRPRWLIRGAHLAGICLFVSGAALYVYLACREAGLSAVSQHVDEIRSRGSDWDVKALAATIAKPFVVFAVFLPGSFFLPFVLTARQRACLPSACSRLVVAAWAFLVAGLAVLMASPTGNTRYYLPLAAPVALLAAVGAERLRCSMVARAAPPAGRRATWKSAHPGVWAITVGLVFWGFYVAGVEPARAVKRSQHAVAALLAPFVPASETVFVDLGDSHSSLLFYLDRPLETRPIDAAAPSGSIFLVLVNEQVDLLAGRSDLVVRILAESRDSEGNRYAAAVAAPRPGEI